MYSSRAPMVGGLFTAPDALNAQKPLKPLFLSCLRSDRRVSPKHVFNYRLSDASNPLNPCRMRGLSNQMPLFWSRAPRRLLVESSACG